MEDGRINEIRCYEEDSLIGNIYIGQVTNILKNINAAFVDIQKGESCYLPMEDYSGEKTLKIGDFLPVQVVKDRIKTKQPTVTTKLSLSGNYVVVHLGDTIGVSAKIKEEKKRKELKQCFFDALNEASEDISWKLGGIIRTQAEKEEKSEIIREAKELANELINLLQISNYAALYSCIYHTLPAYIKDISSLLHRENTEVITDLQEICDFCQEEGIKSPSLYQEDDYTLTARYNLNTVLDKALAKRVYLKSGAYLVIEPTEAMTVIDVNSGKAVKGQNKEEIIFKLNSEAAEEIGRQLRLRNLSGIVIVDFISMKSEEQNKKLMVKLMEEVLKDSVSVQVVDMTSLGLVEITRKKVRKPLHEIIKK